MNMGIFSFIVVAIEKLYPEHCIALNFGYSISLALIGSYKSGINRVLSEFKRLLIIPFYHITFH